MRKKILIAKIKINRDLRPGDDLSDLGPNDLAKPIVVNINSELIDGLRRVKLAEKLGVTELPAYVVDKLEEMSDALAKQHPVALRDWQRVYELMKFLGPAATERWKRVRTEVLQETINLKPRPEGSSRGPTRPFISKALGGTSASQFESVVKLFDGGASPEQIELMRSGAVSPSGIKNRLHRAVPNVGAVSDARDQEILLTTVAQTISAAIRSLEKLHWPLKVPLERQVELREQLFRARSKLSAFMNRQSEEAGK